MLSRHAQWSAGIMHQRAPLDVHRHTREGSPFCGPLKFKDPFSLACAATVILGQTMIGFRLPGLSSCLTREAADDVQTQNDVLKVLLPRWQRRQILANPAYGGTDTHSLSIMGRPAAEAQH